MAKGFVNDERLLEESPKVEDLLDNFRFQINPDKNLLLLKHKAEEI